MASYAGPKPDRPRKLGQTETVQSLNHWKTIFRTYYRRCEYVGLFLIPTTKWDTTKKNDYGFEDEADGAKRKKEVIKEDLDGFFDSIAGYLPHDYVSSKLRGETTCIEDVWRIIYDIYDAEVSPRSFLDYVALKKEPEETYRNFWNRLVGYVSQHLAKNPADGSKLTVEGATVPEAGDTISVTMLDLITIHWMSEIDSRLHAAVKIEFATDLKTKRVCQLVKRIATNADDLLKRYEAPKDQVQKISQPVTPQPQPATICATNSQSSGKHDSEDIIARINRIERNQRKFQKRNEKKGFPRRNEECGTCDFLNRKLGANIDKYHSKDKCPRKSMAIKLIQEDWPEDAVSTSSSSDTEGELPGDLKDLYYILSLQNDSAWSVPMRVVKSRIRTVAKKLKTPKSILSTNKNQQINETQHVRVSDQGGQPPDKPESTLSPLLRAVETSNYNWNNIMKSSSPRMKSRRAGTIFASLLDTGAVINVIDEKFALKTKIDFENTKEVAQAANHLPLEVVGQSAQPVEIEAITKEGFVTIKLGIVLVIRNLGVDVLIGEPGKKQNNIVCWPKQEMILFADALHTAPYFKAKKPYTLARVSNPTVLQPGEEWEFALPSDMAHLNYVSVAPRPEARKWLEAGILEVTDGIIKLKNTSLNPVMLGKHEHLVDVRDTIEFNIPAQVRFVLNPEEKDKFQFTDLNQSDEDPEKYLDQCKIDPDGILTEAQREKFRTINQRFARIITPRPGKYNGFYGEIDNRIHWSQKPAPNTKTRIPNYSPAMNKLLGEKMDKLEEWGVLAAPEKVGVTVEHVQPTMLVPKKDPGEYRCVTDFSTINKSIKRVPNTSATIAQAKARIAKAEYVIHLDLSNYFYQNGMQKVDVQYLGTVHPFKGVRVYTCDPQGCKGASERGYEKLVRIYGDLIQDEKLAQMADGLHVLGKTVDEVTENYIEVLNRAENAGLTFKPSQVIICPKNITLFGWDLRGSVWQPTAHTTSALVNAPRPVTVKQMRSFIGAFKQISSCIPGYARALHGLDKVVGGRASAERLQWGDELVKNFEAAKKMAADPRGIVEPRPSDQLHTYSDWSEQHRAVGGRLMIHRTKKDGTVEILNGGFYSSILNKHKKAWLPCEGEAAGIRFVLEHFQQQIRESRKVTIHHTDSQPCVMAWKRAQRGAFSSSARIAAFLTGLSSLPVEVQYTPGKQMHTSDFASRHPTECSNPKKCQICQFTDEWEQIGDNTTALRSVTVDDIKSGRSVMPMIQRKVWRNIQRNDSTITKLLHLIDTEQLPETKKTKGDYTKLKLLHGQYRSGKLVIDKDGLLLIKTPDGTFNGAAILVPHHLFMGVMSAIHLRLDHPSKAQLIGLAARYFYTPGWRSIIEEVSDNCHQCAAAKTLPAVLLSDNTTINEGFGTEFGADVIEREGQKILVVKEKLSQYIRASIIPDQTADTFRQELIRLTVDLIPDSGTTIRVDGATAFQSLEKESTTKGTTLNNLKIKIEVGRLLNKNKNASVEIANKELEKEILRLKQSRGKISPTDLSLVLKNINNRIRYHGLSSREIMFRRNMINNEEKNVRDTEVANKQHSNRVKESEYSEKHKMKSKKKTKQADFKAGDLVYLRAGRDKNNLRDLYSVEMIEEDGSILIRKYNSSLRAKLYRALPDELVSSPINAAKRSSKVRSEKISTTEKQTDQQEMAENIPSDPRCDENKTPEQRRPRRKAFESARKKLGYKVKTIETLHSSKFRFGWNTEDQDSDSDDEFYTPRGSPVFNDTDETVSEVEDTSDDDDDDDAGDHEGHLEGRVDHLPAPPDNSMAQWPGSGLVGHHPQVSVHIPMRHFTNPDHFHGHVAVHHDDVPAAADELLPEDPVDPAMAPPGTSMASRPRPGLVESPPQVYSSLPEGAHANSNLIHGRVTADVNDPDVLHHLERNPLIEEEDNSQDLSWDNSPEQFQFEEGTKSAALPPIRRPKIRRLAVSDPVFSRQPAFRMKKGERRKFRRNLRETLEMMENSEEEIVGKYRKPKGREKAFETDDADDEEEEATDNLEKENNPDTPDSEVYYDGDDSTPWRAPQGPRSSPSSDEDQYYDISDQQMLELSESLTKLWEDQDSKPSGARTPISPAEVDLQSVNNLGPALDQALRAINPVDTIQLGTAAPVVNLDNIDLTRRARRQVSQPSNYKTFHTRGTR